MNDRLAYINNKNIQGHTFFLSCKGGISTLIPSTCSLYHCCYLYDHKAWGSSAFQQAIWLPGTTSTLTSRLISVFNCHKFSTLRVEGNLLRQRKIFSKIKRKKFANAKSLLTLLQEQFFDITWALLCLMQCKILLDFSLFVAQDGTAAGWHLPD